VLRLSRWKARRREALDGNQSIYSRRLWDHRFNLAVSLLTMLIGCLARLDPADVVPGRFRSLGRRSFITNDSAHRGATASLNAIAGSLIMARWGTLIGTPIGMMAGIYLAEFGKPRLARPVTRVHQRYPASAPSIVVGFFRV